MCSYGLIVWLFSRTGYGSRLSVYKRKQPNEMKTNNFIYKTALSACVTLNQKGGVQ